MENSLCLLWSLLVTNTWFCTCCIKRLQDKLHRNVTTIATTNTVSRTDSCHKLVYKCVILFVASEVKCRLDIFFLRNIHRWQNTSNKATLLCERVWVKEWMSERVGTTMDILGLFLAQSTCVQSNCKNSSHRKSDSPRHFCNLRSCQKRNLCNHDIFCRPILFVSVVLVAVPSCCSRHLRIVGNHLKTTPHNQRDHICTKKKLSSLSLSLCSSSPLSLTVVPQHQRLCSQCWVCYL